MIQNRYENVHFPASFSFRINEIFFSEYERFFNDVFKKVIHFCITQSIIVLLICAPNARSLSSIRSYPRSI